MNQLEIRVASPGDATLILLLMREFYGHFDDLRFDEVNTTRALNQLLANREKGVVLTGHLDNEPIGYLALVFSHSLELFGSVAWIDEFCVRQQHRSKGYGTAMLRHAEDLSLIHI